MFGTSTPRVPTVLAEAFLGEWMTPERRTAADRRVEMGLHVRRRLAARRGHARGEGPHARDVRAAMAGDPSSAWWTAGLLPGAQPDVRQPRARRQAACWIGCANSRTPVYASVCRRAVHDRQRRCARRCRSGTPFSAVQATWNVLETSAGAALAEAHDAGWFVVVKEAVANGRLTSPRRRDAVQRVRRQHGVAPDALAIGAAVAQPWADVVLSGATTTATGQQPRLPHRRPTHRVRPATGGVLDRTLIAPMDLTA